MRSWANCRWPAAPPICAACRQAEALAAPHPIRIDHDVPVTPVVRLTLALAGLAMLLIPAWLLRQGLWPPGSVALMSVLIVLATGLMGAFFLGAAMIVASSRWMISPGHLSITVHRPFRPAETHAFTPRDQVRFALKQLDWVETQDMWKVMLTAPDGRTFASRPFPSAEDAEALRNAAETLFRSKR
jgi:hypothetical protein